MTINVYGVNIVSNKIVGDIFPVSIKIIDVTIDSLQQGATYVKLSKGDQNVNRDDENAIASIPVMHPEEITIDESNWAGFLYSRLLDTENRKISVSNRLVPMRGYRSIVTHALMGRYYFEIEGVGASIGILVERHDALRPHFRRVPNQLVLKPGISDVDRIFVQYNNTEIMVPVKAIGDPISKKRYSAKFKEKLTPLEEMKVYVEGKVGDILSVDRIGNPQTIRSVDPTRVITALYGLYPKSFYGFEWFKSGDDKLLFTLHADPLQAAFNAFSSATREVGAAKFERFAKEYPRLTALYARFGNLSIYQEKILGECIALFES